METRIRPGVRVLILIVVCIIICGYSVSVETQRPKNVHVALRAKWPGTPLLLEAGYIPISRYSSASLLISGDRLKQTRIFSSEDLVEFSKLSYDENPLHLDPEYARNAGFKDKLVPGILVASLFPRIIASHFPGAVYASQTLHFRLPVYVEEEIIGEVEATSIRETKKKYMCFNNTRDLVLDGEAMAILPTLSLKQA